MATEGPSITTTLSTTEHIKIHGRFGAPAIAIAGAISSQIGQLSTQFNRHQSSFGQDFFLVSDAVPAGRDLVPGVRWKYVTEGD